MQIHLAPIPVKEWKLEVAANWCIHCTFHRLSLMTLKPRGQNWTNASFALGMMMPSFQFDWIKLQRGQNLSRLCHHKPCTNQENLPKHLKCRKLVHRTRQKDCNTNALCLLEPSDWIQFSFKAQRLRCSAILAQLGFPPTS